jgi:hypothetical protein
LSEPVREIAIAIRGVSAMGRIVLPRTLPLSREPRRAIGGTPVQVVNVTARAVNLVVPVVNFIVPVLAVIIVVVVAVIDLSISVAPIVIPPRVATGRRKSIPDVGIIVTGAGPGIAGVAGII